MTDIVLSVWSSQWSVVSASEPVRIEIRDYDVPEDWDTDVFVDDAGERYERTFVDYVPEQKKDDPLDKARVIVTTAPDNYDYEGTVLDSVVLSTGKHDKVYRRVALDSCEGGYYADYQTTRYASGMYYVATLEEFEDLRQNYPQLL